MFYVLGKRRLVVAVATPGLLHVHRLRHRYAVIDGLGLQTTAIAPVAQCDGHAGLTRQVRPCFASELRHLSSPPYTIQNSPMVCQQLTVGTKSNTKRHSKTAGAIGKTRSCARHQACAHMVCVRLVLRGPASSPMSAAVVLSRRLAAESQACHHLQPFRSSAPGQEHNEQRSMDCTACVFV